MHTTETFIAAEQLREAIATGRKLTEPEWEQAQRLSLHVPDELRPDAAGPTTEERQEPPTPLVDAARVADATTQEGATLVLLAAFETRLVALERRINSMTDSIERHLNVKV